MEQKKRLCLFAGFNAQGEIADYVIYYLKALSKIAEVYYWGDFESSDDELAKLKPICKGAFCQKHSKYDFGSWQELIHKIGRREIVKYDEVILANDSCYGPLFDLSELFQEMDARDCDFWGLSSAYNCHIHSQSYFIVLKQPVIQSDVFYNFFEEVKPEENYDNVCLNYEDRFTYILSKAGFRPSSFIAYNELANHPYQDIISAIKNRHFPFIKAKFFFGGISNQGGVADWRKTISEYTNYPVELIEKDLLRRGFSLEEIDRAVREKRCESPSLNYKKTSLKRCIRKIGKTILKPVLRKRANSIAAPQDIFFREGGNPCGVELSSLDATVIKRFDLDLSLTRESNILIVGAMPSYKISSLGVYKPRAVYLNGRRGGSGKQKFQTKNLCNFKFVNETGRLIYFDFILVQPLKAGITDTQIKRFIINLKRQMLYESVLVMLVSDAEAGRYEQILQSQGLWPAKSERGIVARVDPFQLYYDKIESIKGYKPLIYKIK